jgi:hypothetical protein
MLKYKMYFKEIYNYGRIEYILVNELYHRTNYPEELEFDLNEIIFYQTIFTSRSNFEVHGPFS